MTFTLSIETDAGTYQHGYHLGTIEDVARDVAARIYFNNAPRQGAHIKTVALIREGRMFDVFDGKWSSDRWDGEEA